MPVTLPFQDKESPNDAHDQDPRDHVFTHWRSADAERRSEDVGEVFANLEKSFPGIRQRVVQGEALVRFMNVYVNDTDVRFDGGLRATVRDGDTITILPAVAGGRGGNAAWTAAK